MLKHIEKLHQGLLANTISSLTFNGARLNLEALSATWDPEDSGFFGTCSLNFGFTMITRVFPVSSTFYISKV